MDSILDEISIARKEIKTDHYNMSVGEIVNLYNEKEITLNPAFQRLFRWRREQKSNFIESLILGFPIPPIFVAQQDSGHWDIVDGVQRVSTILQLFGKLNDHQPLVLDRCKYIPSLEEYTWETLPPEVKRIIKRSKLTINIILTDNSITAQYEVFQRLNTGGLHLSSQEIRNCLIIMSDNEFYNQINEFKDNEYFVKITPITEEKFKEEYRMELIIRYFIGKSQSTQYDSYSLNSIHVRDFLDKEIKRLINAKEFSLVEELSLLGDVSKFLFDILSTSPFQKKHSMSQKFSGNLTLKIFEVIMPGIARNFGKIKSIDSDKLRGIIDELQSHPEFIQATKKGSKALTRFKRLTNLSCKYFDAYEIG